MWVECGHVGTQSDRPVALAGGCGPVSSPRSCSPAHGFKRTVTGTGDGEDQPFESPCGERRAGDDERARVVPVEKIVSWAGGTVDGVSGGRAA